MRKIEIKIFIAGLLLLIPFLSVSAQDKNEDSKEEKKAEKWYDDLGYSAALDAYNAKEDGTYDLEDLIKIAESHRKNADYYNAQKWYGQVVKQTDEPIYKLYYAQALQANGHYEAAREFFLEYDSEANKGLGEGETADRRGAMGAQACAAIQNFRYAKDVTIRNVAELNTDKLDFSPSYVKGGLLFVSTRDNESMAKRKDTWINDNFMELYYAKKGDVAGVFAEPESFSPEVNTKYHEGPTTMDKDGRTMYFTRNNYNKGKRGRDKQKVTLLKVYTATKNNDDEWGSVKELGFNSDDFHSCHPTLSADGQKLYFSSNRPGGYGGMDIYVSESLGGTWSEPVNLGEEVNTKGNEVFPFIHDSGLLYYASNGLPGLGGLDIFTASPVQKNEEVVWSNVNNLGQPFNSKKDDFGFIMDEDGTSGYFTSSRPGGKGEDDIYSWRSSVDEIEIEDEEVMIAGMMGVCDAETGERIAGAKVVAFEGEELSINETDVAGDGYVLGIKPTENDGDYVLSIQKTTEKGGGSEVFTTDDKGEFQYMMKPGKRYIFKVVKMGYADADDSYETEMVASSTSISHCIPMVRRTCTQLVGKVYNEVYKDKIIPKAKVTLINKCNGEMTQVESEIDGSFEFCLECGCEYQLLGTKTNFSQDKERVSLLNRECDGTVKQDLHLTFGMDDVVASNPAPQPAPYPYPAYPPPNPGAYLSNTFGGNYNGNMTGRSIVLEKLYYDFDEFYIRPDASRELDKVVQLMREFPSMEIELSSHTDARGTDKYNEKLSQNRANAAVEYIISKGIAASRLTARGYGENYPRNRCKDQVDCPEEDHQYNRRTEIKITRFARYNEVRVDYIDNAPEVIDRADPNRKWIWD